MRITRRAGRALAVALLGALGACTNSPPTPVPTAGTPLSTMPSSSPSPSTSSAAPTTSDEQLAIDATRRYYDAFNAAMKTLDTSAWRLTFTQGCRVCKEDAAKVDEAKASGRTFIGGGFTFADPFVTSRPDPKRILVRATTSSPAMQVKDAAGNVVDRSDGGTGPKDFIVYQTPTGWLVEGLTRG